MEKLSDERVKMWYRSNWAAKVLFAALCAGCLLLGYMGLSVDRHTHFTPNYKKIKLESILGKADLSKNDYRILMDQTGLGKIAIDDLIGTYNRKYVSAWASEVPGAAPVIPKNEQKDLVNQFREYQDDFFSKAKSKCSSIGWVTEEERMETQGGKEAFHIEDVKNGDVFISESTHTMGWRHGHAALVIDSEKGELLEATLWNEPVTVKHLSNWEDYSTFLQLRPKAGIDGDAIAKYAKDNLKGIRYGLLSGLPIKMPKKIKKTQCAHLVWYAYRKFGCDIDSDGGWLVTPKDIATSNCFDVVQVYGVDPEKLWK